VRFGLDALIGLFPVVGDIITTALSLFIVHEAYQLGAPGHVIARMLGNVALDGVFGAVQSVRRQRVTDNCNDRLRHRLLAVKKLPRAH